MKSYINLDIYKHLLNFVKIPDGIYNIKKNGKIYKYTLRDYWITDTLITNSLILQIFNEQNIINHKEGTYLFFNDVNSTSSFYYDIKKGAYEVKDGFEEHPIQGMTWYGAKKLARMLGGGLPSEIEWEICAKAGRENYLYPWGTEKPDRYKANYGNILGRTSKVREYPPNEWGLYDMAGNLKEWCLDCFHPDFPFAYSFYPDVSSACRVVKGGAWDKTEIDMLCSTRTGKWARIGTMGIGFRICKHERKLPV